MDPRRRLKVALFVDTFNGWGRRLVRGVMNFMEKNGAWDIDVMAREGDDARLPPDWNGDGIIARVSTPKMARWICKQRVPVVNVSGIPIRGCELPRVTADVMATAKLAADHFAERGYRCLSYMAPLGHPFVPMHAKAFVEYVSQIAGTPAQFDSTALLADPMSRRRLNELSRWLKGLATPCGLFTWSIADAAIVLRLCRKLNIAVPDDLAVLAGDDDEIACSVCQPSLSGFVVASEQIGFSAAARLQAMMDGEPDNGKPIFIPPIEVRTRNSTNALAIGDDDLRKAVQYMRGHLHRSININQIADSVPLNRRSLERKFRAQFGTSPLEELLRLRLAKMRQMLSLTDLPISRISTECGFTSPTYMTAVFRGEQGITPIQYRKQVRTR